MQLISLSPNPHTFTAVLSAACNFNLSLHRWQDRWGAGGLLLRQAAAWGRRRWLLSAMPSKRVQSVPRLAGNAIAHPQQRAAKVGARENPSPSREPCSARLRAWMRVSAFSLPGAGDQALFMLEQGSQPRRRRLPCHTQHSRRRWAALRTLDAHLTCCSVCTHATWPHTDARGSGRVKLHAAAAGRGWPSPPPLLPSPTAA